MPKLTQTKYLMDILKYRKLYLCENWSSNAFHAVVCPVNGHGFPGRHARVLSGEAFWLNDRELCIGYEMRLNPNIFRPIFSHKRQYILETVHWHIIRPRTFWRRVKTRYYVCMAKIKTLPLECVAMIVHFIY